MRVYFGKEKAYGLSHTLFNISRLCTAPPGFEPGTCALTVRYSTAELWSNLLFTQLFKYNNMRINCQQLNFIKLNFNVIQRFQKLWGGDCQRWQQA